MARTSRRQPNSYRGGRVVGNLAYDERYAELSLIHISEPTRP